MSGALASVTGVQIVPGCNAVAFLGRAFGKLGLEIAEDRMGILFQGRASPNFDLDALHKQSL